jgi:hypothetical protein
LIIVFCGFLLPYLIITALLLMHERQINTSYTPLLWSSCTLMISIYATVFQIRASRRRLPLLLAEPNAVRLTPGAIEFSILLLAKDDPNLFDLQEAKRSRVHIAWKDILSWQVFNNGRAVRACHYLTTTENIVTRYNKSVILLREFSKTDEKSLLVFVKRHGVKVRGPSWWQC